MICFVHIGIWFNLFLLPLFIFFSWGEDRNPHPLSMWSSSVFVCSLPGKHATATGFLTIPTGIWFYFSLSFGFVWGFAYIVSSFLSAAQSAQGRERAIQARVSFSPLSCVLYLPEYQGTQFFSSRSCMTEGKKIQTFPHPPSILHVVDQTDSASLKVIVAGVIPLGWMCMVCTFFFSTFRNLKTTKNERQLFNLSQVTLKALCIYL